MIYIQFSHSFHARLFLFNKNLSFSPAAFVLLINCHLIHALAKCVFLLTSLYLKLYYVIHSYTLILLNAEHKNTVCDAQHELRRQQCGI